MATSWNKKERENKKKEARKKKEEQKLQRKEAAVKGKSLDEMMVYLDENGNLSPIPPDPSKKVEIDPDSIVIGVPKQTGDEPDAHIRKGVVSFFNEGKGFGFIEEERFGQRIFVHQSSSAVQLKEGLNVAFEIEKGPRGLTAVNVSAVSQGQA